MALGHGERGECLDVEVGAIGTRDDEGCREGEDGTRAQRRIERLRHSDLLGKHANGRLVPRLDSEDRAGGAQDALVRQERRGAEIGRNTNVLEYGGRGNHAGGIGELEVILACLNGLDAALSEGRLQESDVLGLGGADVLEVRDGRRVEAKGGEVRVGKLSKASSVEGFFEVLKSQGAVGGSVVLVSC